MKSAASLALMALIGLASAEEPKPLKLDLSSVKAGELPKGWSAAKTGKGDGSIWHVVDSSDAPGGKALAQTSDKGPGPLFNLCLLGEPSFKDLDLTVSFQAQGGKIDQGGGALWRCKDADNYYVARMNPLEDNFRLYKVVAGKRTQLGTATVEGEKGKRYVLRVVHTGNHIQCYLDGKLHLDVKDDTFSEAGKIGLWTKADAQTHFANLTVNGK